MYFCYKESMYQDRFGLQANNYLNKMHCKLTFDNFDIEVHVIHFDKHALFIEFNVTCIQTHSISLKSAKYI